MPVPKKRLGHSDQGHRRSQWKATVPTIGVCPNCGAPKLAHTLCGLCGFYNGRVVLKQAAVPAGVQDNDHDHDHDHGGHDHSH